MKSPPLRTSLAAIPLCLGLTAGLSHAFCFEQAAQQFSVSPHVLWVMADEESGFNPVAVNYNTDGSLDFGVMQINSINVDVLRRVGIPWETLSDPCVNVKAGAYLLSLRMKEYGNTWKAIGAYHSKTPSKRDRYARRIAKRLAVIIPLQMQAANTVRMEQHAPVTR